jgi:hypothetical protein
MIDELDKMTLEQTEGEAKAFFDDLTTIPWTCMIREKIKEMKKKARGETV